MFLFRGMAGAAAIACATRSSGTLAEANSAACKLTAEQTLGPYYLDLERMRQDLTEGKPGLPVKLRLTVVDATRCLPIEHAALDIWHCDAMGIYSGFTANSPDGPPGMGRRGFGGPPPGVFPDSDEPRMPPPPNSDNRKHDDTTFLRGVQLTDHAGVVEFSTIYPGWYMGRDVHIHMRAHVGGHVTESKYAGGHISYTGQLFFPEQISDAVARCEPYRGHHTERTRQDEDNVFTTQHGSGSLVTLAQIDKREIEAGFVTAAVLGIDPGAISRETGSGGPGGGRGRRPGPPPEGWPGELPR